MDEGTTTVGSIVSKLKMDLSDFIAGKNQAKEEARELENTSPTIRVDADVASALSRIESVRAAEQSLSGGTTTVRGAGAAGAARADSTAAAQRRLAAATDAVSAAELRLAAAESASDSATAKALVAEQLLEEKRTGRRMTDGQLAAAELTVAEAIKRADRAAEQAVLSETALDRAQERAARSALELAAAQEASRSATVRANEANKTSFTRFGLIATAIGTLIPLLVPVAAFAVAGAVALGMMGVAGVFAVLGIRREMQQGTSVGLQYSSAVKALGRDMRELAQTGANQMLASFRGVVHDTNAAMPMLNNQVGVFSMLLGRSAGNLFSGTLTGLRVMQPLLFTTGVYLEHLTAQFEAWTGNGGLEKFAGYAIGALPQVEQVLAAVGNAIMHIIEALQPIGAVGIAMLTTLSDGISDIPVDTLTALIAALIYGTLAFKAWGFVAPMLSKIASELTAMGAATTIATGPIGWLVAGVGALAAMLAIVAVQNQNATHATGQYTAAVQADTGAVGENVRAKAAQKLLDEGAFDSAKKLGISSQLILAATLNETGARKQLNAELEIGTAGSARLKSRMDETGLSINKLSSESLFLKDIFQKQSGDIQNTVKDYNTLQEATGQTTNATTAQGVAVARLAAAGGVSVSAYLKAKSAQSQTKAQLEATTAAMYSQNDAAGLLKQQLDLLNGKTINAAQAQNQFDSQIANMSKHINAAGKEINRADTLLKGNTASAVKNRGELIGLTQAAENNAQAYRDNGGSADGARKKLVDMKKTIIENAVAHGENRKEVKAFIDQIFKIPKKVAPTELEVKDEAATARIKALKALIASIPRNVGITVATTGQATFSDSRNSASDSDRGKKKGDGKSVGGTVEGAGTTTSDSVMTPLSVGEEVTRASRAFRFRPVLKALNNGSDSQIAAAVAPLAAPRAQQKAGDIRSTVWNVTQNYPVHSNPASDVRNLASFVNAGASS